MAAPPLDPKQCLDLALDGAPEPSLPPDEGPELAHERRQLEQLHRLLVADRVVARPGFTREVMAALPATPPWQQPRLRGWKPAVGVLAALLAVATGLLAVGGNGLSGGSPALSAARAVSDFAVAAALSGSGLLAASWRGVGMAVGAALSLPAYAVFGAGVIALDVLLFVLLRRPRRRRAAERVRRRR